MRRAGLCRRAVPAAVLLLSCHGAHAARPLVVDDASILDAHHCQLEAWTQHAPAQREYWAVPACNVGGRWELAAGLGRIGPDNDRRAFHAGVVQAKTVFRQLATDDWGIGLTVANQFRQGDGVAGDVSVLVPVSVSLAHDRILLHANAGWLRLHADGSHGGLWAAGGEWATTSRVALTLEAYGTQRGHAVRQAGVRLTLIPDRLAFDAGLGTRAGGGERYATFGLTLAGPRPGLPW